MLALVDTRGVTSAQRRLCLVILTGLDEEMSTLQNTLAAVSHVTRRFLARSPSSTDKQITKASIAF